MQFAFPVHRFLSAVLLACVILLVSCSDDDSSVFIIDSDGDGMFDGQERRLGTSPDNPDTDGDGLPDGNEDRNNNGRVDDDETSPLLADTDGDGLCDGWSKADGCVGGELFAGTDPLNADTDSDGLLDGQEDLNGDGEISLERIDGLRETDPLDVDTDDDGIPDGEEDLNANGKLNAGETDPGDPDSDDNGACDGERIDNDGDGLDPADGCFWKVVYVSERKDISTRDGQSWDTAYKRIQDAVDRASVGTGVWIQKGYYTSLGTEPVVIMKDGVSLFGGFDGDEDSVDDRSTDLQSYLDNGQEPGNAITILDGNELGNPVVLGASNTVMDGLLIANGKLGSAELDTFHDGAGLNVEGASYMRLNNVAFYNNHSINGGGLFAIDSNLIIQHCIFKDNTAELGGALYSNANARVKILGASFQGNKASNGGAIFNSSTAIDITRAVFDDNRAFTGGAIFMAESDANIYQTKFRNNVATTGGGITNDRSEANILESEFLSNEAEVSGGALFHSSVTNTEVRQTVFVDNKSARGGAIYNAGSDIAVADSLFSANIAQGVEIDNSEQSINSVGSGGAIYNVADSNPLLTNNAFIANVADNGAAMYSLFSAAEVSDSVFAYNSAVMNGGAIVEEQAYSRLYSSSLVGNTSNALGGAIYSESSNSRFINLLVRDNTAGGAGGGIYNYGSYSQFVNSTFSYNSSAYHAGAIVNNGKPDPSSVLQVYNSLFWGNTGAYEDFVQVVPEGIKRFDSNCVQQDIADRYGSSVNQVLMTQVPLLYASAGQYVYLDPLIAGCVNAGNNEEADLRFPEDWRNLNTVVGASGDAGIVDMGRHYVHNRIRMLDFSADSQYVTWQISTNPASNSHQCIFINDSASNYRTISAEDVEWQEAPDQAGIWTGSMPHGLLSGDRLRVVCMDLDETNRQIFVAGLGEPAVDQVVIP